MSHWLLKEHRADVDTLRKRLRKRNEMHLLPAMTCISDAKKLLQRHRLDVPESTVDMLAHTILYVPSRNKRGVSPLPKFKKAHKHAKALLKCLHRPHPPAKSITYRWESLRDALADDISVQVSLTTGPLRYDVYPLLATFSPGGIDIKGLQLLIMALEHQLDGSRTGRPPAKKTVVIRGAMIAWVMAGEEKGYWFNFEDDTLSGPLPCFIHDLFNICGMKPPNDPALHQRIVEFNKNWKTSVPVTKCN